MSMGGRATPLSMHRQGGNDPHWRQRKFQIENVKNITSFNKSFMDLCLKFLSTGDASFDAIRCFHGVVKDFVLRFWHTLSAGKNKLPEGFLICILQKDIGMLFH